MPRRKEPTYNDYARQIEKIKAKQEEQIQLMIKAFESALDDTAISTLGSLSRSDLRKVMKLIMKDIGIYVGRATGHVWAIDEEIQSIIANVPTCPHDIHPLLARVYDQVVTSRGRVSEKAVEDIYKGTDDWSDALDAAFSYNTRCARELKLKLEHRNNHS